MEDIGWYFVNYEMVDFLCWGRNLGCLFIKNSCVVWMKVQKIVGKFIVLFCFKIKKQGDLWIGCFFDRIFVVLCNLVEYE